MDFSVLPLAAFILTAIGWLSREIWRWRKAKRLAAEDAVNTLNQRKALLEDMISKVEDDDSKQTLVAQLDEVNVALLGLYGERLRHTLKQAGLPPEEMLIADGRSRLQPQQVDQLKKITAEVKALPPSLSVYDLLAQGNAYYYAEQYEDAKDIYDRILNLNPNDPATLNNRGLVYAKLERYEEALADFNRSLELNPDHPSTLYNLACLSSLKGKADDVLTWLEKAIKGDEKYREKAKTDKDFNNIRENPRFKKLTEQE